MRAALHDSAALDDEDLVGMLDGREPVRDDDHRLPPRELGEGLLYEGLVLWVDARRRLAEEQVGHDAVEAERHPVDDVAADDALDVVVGALALHDELSNDGADDGNRSAVEPSHERVEDAEHQDRRGQHPALSDAVRHRDVERHREQGGNSHDPTKNVFWGASSMSSIIFAAIVRNTMTRLKTTNVRMSRVVHLPLAGREFSACMENPP